MREVNYKNVLWKRKFSRLAQWGENNYKYLLNSHCLFAEYIETLQSFEYIYFILQD